jgi:AcrR family transcriptional regulator
MAPRAKPGGKAASAAPAAVPNGKPRRLTPKGEATRARLIGLAAEVFATEGYATVSMRDIATRMGLSIGAIYGSFRSKADLLAEAVDATIASDVETLPASVRELTLPEIDAYQYRHLAKRERARALLLEAAVAARTDPGVRERLRDALVPHIDMATEAHEEWRLSAGVSPRCARCRRPRPDGMVRPGPPPAARRRGTGCTTGRPDTATDPAPAQFGNGGRGLIGSSAD